mgnify:CR=1 FL=1
MTELYFENIKTTIERRRRKKKKLKTGDPKVRPTRELKKARPPNPKGTKEEAGP